MQIIYLREDPRDHSEGTGRVRSKRGRPMRGDCPLWWFIICANLTEPSGTQIFGQTSFWVYVWGCVWMRLTSEPVDWVKQIALPSVGGPHPVSWRPDRTKSLSEWELLLPVWAGTLVFSYLWTWIEVLALSGPPACQFSDWNSQSELSWVRLADWSSWDFSAYIIMWANFL